MHFLPPPPALGPAAGPPGTPGPSGTPGLPTRWGLRPGRPTAARRRFRLPVVGSLRYRLLVAWLAAVVVVAGGVLWLQRAALKSRATRPRARPGRRTGA